MKRMFSLLLAVLMASAMIGCTAVPGTSVPDNTEEVQNTMPVACLNEKGQIVPLSMHFSDENKIQTATYDPRYTVANNDFAITMINSMDDNATEIFSPLSLQIALQILANGGDEATANVLLEEICPGMSMEAVNESSSNLIAAFLRSNGVNISNAVIADKNSRLCEKFANIAADSYRASVGALDFSDPVAALNEINGWVRENTDGLIDRLLDELGTDTSIVILNALTLKLNWAEPFTAMRELTEFHGTNGKLQSIGMMNIVTELQYGSFDQGEMAIVPYEGGEYAMAVILPASGVSAKDAAASLLGRADECSTKMVGLKMPKIDIDSKFDILAMADKLNIEEGVSGCFPRLVADGAISVTQIVQGAMLSVTETGTTAAAATAIVGRKSLSPSRGEVEMLCDRPYAMVIYHVETGAVLFVSLVNNVVD